MRCNILQFRFFEIQRRFLHSWLSANVLWIISLFLAHNWSANVSHRWGILAKTEHPELIPGICMPANAFHPRPDLSWATIGGVKNFDTSISCARITRDKWAARVFPHCITCEYPARSYRSLSICGGGVRVCVCRCSRRLSEPPCHASKKKGKQKVEMEKRNEVKANRTKWQREKLNWKFQHRPVVGDGAGRMAATRLPQLTLLINKQTADRSLAKMLITVSEEKLESQTEHCKKYSLSITDLKDYVLKLSRL